MCVRVRVRILRHDLALSSQHEAEASRAAMSTPTAGNAADDFLDALEQEESDDSDDDAFAF